jgi:hypothetical protein
LVSTPRLSYRPPGTGDLFTALFAAALVQGHTTGAALGRAVSGVYGVLEETERWQSHEMALIASAVRMLRPQPPLRAIRHPARADRADHRRCLRVFATMTRAVPAHNWNGVGSGSLSPC